MPAGRSIRLFLVDGTSNGLLTAEIMNWTGHVLASSRSKVSELIQRPECARTGIYFLVGPDPENPFLTRVYVGESDDIARRLRQHNRPETQGGKDFWERVCLVTSKDMNLTKAHAKYLESRLIAIASAAGRCVLENGTAHEYRSLPESDLADMAFFLDQIRTILPVLGFEFLHETVKVSSAGSSFSPQSAVLRFNLHLPTLGIEAEGQEVDGEFVVLKGSQARERWVGVPSGYQALFEQLVASGMLVLDDKGRRCFTENCSFSSPSAAASVISGRAANGRVKWTVQGSSETYAEWQERTLAISAPTHTSTADEMNLT